MMQFAKCKLIKIARMSGSETMVDQWWNARRRTMLLMVAFGIYLHRQPPSSDCVAASKARRPGVRFCPAPPSPSSKFSAHSPSACKEVHLIRHAEGLHNEAERGPTGTQILLEENSGREFWDARLTARGEAQCRALRRSIDRRATGAGSAKNSAGLEEQQGDITLVVKSCKMKCC